MLLKTLLADSWKVIEKTDLSLQNLEKFSKTFQSLEEFLDLM